MSYSAGWIIPAHTNNPLKREIFLTQEALFIRKGKVRVDFYTDKAEYLSARFRQLCLSPSPLDLARDDAKLCEEE